MKDVHITTRSHPGPGSPHTGAAWSLPSSHCCCQGAAESKVTTKASELGLYRRLEPASSSRKDEPRVQRFPAWTNSVCRGGVAAAERDEEGKMADGESCRHSCSINVITAAPDLDLDLDHPDLGSEHACGRSREALLLGP